MSKEVNWLKFRLRGAKTAVEAARTNEQVSLFARQALEAAESGLAAALLQWDTPFLTNSEKSWREIIREISRKPAALWHYTTALRGPDVNTPFSPTIKAAFTCPLRGRCAHALGKEAFLELDIKGVKDAFAGALKHRMELGHYLQHFVAVWEAFYPPLGELLADAFFKGIVEPKEAAKRYVKLLDKWMRSKHVIMEEDHEEPR